MIEGHADPLRFRSRLIAPALDDDQRAFKPLVSVAYERLARNRASRQGAGMVLSSSMREGGMVRSPYLPAGAGDDAPDHGYLRVPPGECASLNTILISAITSRRPLLGVECSPSMLQRCSPCRGGKGSKRWTMSSRRGSPCACRPTWWLDALGIAGWSAPLPRRASHAHPAPLRQPCNRMALLSRRAITDEAHRDRSPRASARWSR